MRTVSFSEQSASRPAGRPERAHDAEHDGDGTNGGASHSGGGITNASHPRAQHGGGMRVHHSLAQRTQPPSAIRSRRTSASDPAGGGSDSTVAAPRSSAPPALTAGGATPDTHDVHNATPRATPLGTSRTHTTQTTV